MTTKQAIVRELGDSDILSPDLIATSLIANDRVKYYFALLQTARTHADHPNTGCSDLKAERLASQIGDEWLDDVVAGTRGDKTGYSIPRSGEILTRINTSIATMLACLPPADQAPFSARLQAFWQFMPVPSDGAFPGPLLSAMTSGDRTSGDSLHLVVMDAHKAINRLQAETATTDVDGARSHHLTECGRRRVEAFMRGLNRTAPLKFDHPGLGTTATEHQGLLLIQNDIGTTDAHVLVIKVEELTATVTYTDIHPARLKFFRRLLAKHGLVWQEAEERKSERMESGQYILSTGRYEAADGDTLLEFLDRLGSRIVFLIDWNRMRKRLRLFVDKKTAVTLLEWAADNDYGHRALLEIGGERALAEAVEYAAGAQLRYGVRLDEMIDPEITVAFLKDAFRLACDGLRRQRSRRNINDEIKARLKMAFEKEHLRLFDFAADHAAIGFDLASSIVEALGRADDDSGRAWLGRFTAHAEAWERRADQLLNDARDDIRRFARPRSLLAFFESADDAVDELEEACTLVELARIAGCTDKATGDIKSLAELALAASRELVRSIESAAAIARSDIRDDLDEFMRALESLIQIEHDADDSLRRIRRRLIENGTEQRQLMVLRELAQAIETATDAYTHAAQALRSYLMEEVIG